MAKARSPKTDSTRSKKNGKTNGAPASMPEASVEVAPVTKAEKIAADIAAHRHDEAPVQKLDNPEPLPSAARDLESAIRQRAYQIFLERHGAPGNPNEDWARAEREVINAFKHQQSA